ncbi:hypothetical protein ANN_09350 [Periplaneta americana]|uniref:Uncharacterized protein n=1 Tax=Periplaneta americana TaxID=6978 RepID=A0ABQ8TPN4_PERAM|nr:hypothetical protein ANN_09350 [Periplaneta americana]
MAGLCEGGNEPPGSLKATHEEPRPTSRLLVSRPHAEVEVDDHPTRMESKVALGSVVGIALALYARRCGFDPGPGRWHLSVFKCDRLMSVDLLACDNAGEMSPGSSTESYPAFARTGLKENPGKNLNQITCPDRDSNPGHLVSQPDALTVTPQVCTR